MSIPVSSGSSPTIPIVPSSTLPTPSSTTVATGISTLTPAEQSLIQNVILGSIPIHSSTTELYLATLTGLNDVAQQLNYADYLAGLRAQDSRQAGASCTSSMLTAQERAQVNFVAATTNLDAINSDIDSINNLSNQIQAASPAYNDLMNQLQGLESTYNQAVANLQALGPNASSQNRQNAANAVNTAANNYNNLRLQILTPSSQSGTPGYIYSNYQNLVNSYNSADADLTYQINQKNATLTQFNTNNQLNDPSYPAAPLQDYMTAPLSSLIAPPNAQNLTNLSTNQPPPSYFPAPSFTNYSPLSFTFSGQLPNASSSLNGKLQQWNTEVGVYNNALTSMNGLQNTINQQLSALTTAANNYNATKSNTVTAYNTAVTNYNASISQYNGYVSQLNGAGTSLTSLGNEINAQMLQEMQNPVSGNYSPIPPSTLANLPPPLVNTTTSNPSIHSVIPIQTNAAAVQVSFSPGTPLVDLPPAAAAVTALVTSVIQAFFTFILGFTSLNRTITLNLDSKVPQGLIFLNSIFDNSGTPKQLQVNQSAGSGQGGVGVGGFVTAATGAGQAEQILNSVLQNQTFQEFLNSVITQNPALQQLLSNGKLPQSAQVELLALLGEATVASSLGIAQLLQGVLSTDVNLPAGLTNLAAVLTAVKLFLTSLAGANFNNLAGLQAQSPVTPPGLTNLNPLANANGLLLAAAILAQALGNRLPLLGLGLALQKPAVNSTASQVSENLHNLQAKLTSDQKQEFQQQLQSALTAALSSRQVSSQTISQLSRDILSSNNEQSLVSALNSSLNNADAVQSVLNATDLASSIYGLQAQQKDADTAAIQHSLLSEAIDKHTEESIRNNLESVLRSNNLSNANELAAKITEGIVKISGSPVPLSTGLIQVQNVIQQALGSNSNSGLAVELSNAVNNTLFTAAIKQSALSKLQNHHLTQFTENVLLIKTIETVVDQISETTSKILTSFAKTQNEIAQQNDDKQIKRVTQDFRNAIASVLDLSVLIAELQNPGNTFVGLMYEGMKTSTFHRGWLDFAV